MLNKFTKAFIVTVLSMMIGGFATPSFAKHGVKCKLIQDPLVPGKLITQCGKSGL